MGLFKRRYFEEKYPILTGWLRNHQFLLTCFKLLYYGLPIIMIVIYVGFVIHTFRTKGKRTLKKTVFIPAAAFVLVSLFRRAYNKKRPYENYDYEPLIDKSKAGRSMPSRHTFSAGIIAVTVGHFYPLLAPFMWTLTGLIAITRLVAGVHYIRDVAVALGLAALLGLALKIPVFNRGGEDG